MNRLELSNEDKTWLGEQVVKQINDEEITLSREYLMNNVRNDSFSKGGWSLLIPDGDHFLYFDDGLDCIFLNVNLADDANIGEDIFFANQITTLSKLKQLYSLLTGNALPMKDNLTVK